MVKFEGYDEIDSSIYGFCNDPSESGKALTETLGSLLAILVSYRPRFNKVRVGTTHITLRKHNGEVFQVSISRFGLRSEHSVLMSGCTFNPTLQSSMKQSLGPLTITVNLCMQEDRRYKQAWKTAFSQIFKLVPNTNKIADLIAMQWVAVFSGRCNQRVDLDGALFKTLLESNDEFMDRATERSKLVSKLTKAKAIIANQVRKTTSIAFGTTQFYKASNHGYGDPETSVPELNGKYFYGQEDEV